MAALSPSSEAAVTAAVSWLDIPATEPPPCTHPFENIVRVWKPTSIVPGWDHAEQVLAGYQCSACGDWWPVRELPYSE